MQLVYIADPLCSWCYGFGPELEAVASRYPEATLDLVMGGLRPHNTEPMSAEFRQMLAGHWTQVAELSGLPFSRALIDREDFRYDTEPACRAVVAARGIDATKAYACFSAVQVAFFRDARDVTQAAVLADIAAGCGYDRAAFLELFESQRAKDATRNDFAVTQSMGIGGFPTLVQVAGKRLLLVASGYTKTADVLERLGQVAEAVAAPR